MTLEIFGEGGGGNIIEIGRAREDVERRIGRGPNPKREESLLCREIGFSETGRRCTGGGVGVRTGVLLDGTRVEEELEGIVIAARCDEEGLEGEQEEEGRERHSGIYLNELVRIGSGGGGRMGFVVEEVVPPGPPGFSK